MIFDFKNQYSYYLFVRYFKYSFGVFNLHKKQLCKICPLQLSFYNYKNLTLLEFLINSIHKKDKFYIKNQIINSKGNTHNLENMPQPNQFKSTVMQTIAKDVQKNFIIKEPKLKSHIIFKGDPVFYQQSVQYIPVNRRKKIFDDKQNNVLPPDLLLNQEDLLHHNNKMENQKFINSQIVNSFDRQLQHENNQSGRNMYGDQIERRNRRLATQRSEIYLEPNTLQTDLNFNINPFTREQLNQNNINLSKVSQQTQKKGGPVFQNRTPYSSNATATAPTPLFIQSDPIQSQKVSFSYQGQQFPKNDQIIQNPQRKIEGSPPKLRTKSIFVNQGGVLGPKIIKRPNIQNSDYYDFQNNLQNDVNDSDFIKGIIPLTQKNQRTPEFQTKRPQKYTQNNNQVTRALYNQLKSLQTDNSPTTQQNLMKSYSEQTKNLINDKIYTNISNLTNNQINNSINSYKSLSKLDNQFVNNNFTGQTIYPVQNIQQKPLNIQRKTSRLSSTAQLKPNESLIMKVSEQAIQKQQNKLKKQNSLKINQNGTSLFDQIFDQRENTFGKSNPLQIPSQRKAFDKQIKTMIAMGSQNNINTSNSKKIHQPDDFITDSKFLPKAGKKSIHINNLPENQQEPLKEPINSNSSLLQSRAQSIQINKSGVVGPSQFKNTKEQIISSEIINPNKKNTKLTKIVPRNKGKTSEKIRKNAQELLGQYEQNQSDAIYQSDEQDQSDKSNEPQSQQFSSDAGYNYDKYGKKLKKRQNKKIQEKSRKMSKQKSKQKKKIKKPQNDEQLLEFLQGQQQRLYEGTAQKYVSNLPAGKINKNRKNSQGKMEALALQNQKSVKQPVIVTNLQMLTPEQKNLLYNVGFKLIGNNQQSKNSNKVNNTNIQSVNNRENPAYSQQAYQSGNNIEHTYNNQFIPGNNNMPLHKGYEHNPEELEGKFQEITKNIYKELCKFLQKKSSIFLSENQASFNENTPNFKSHIQKLTESVPFSNKQIGSTVQFNNPNQFQSQSYESFRQKEPIHTKNHRVNNFIEPRRDELYNQKIYNELKNFNNQQVSYTKRNDSKQKYESLYRDDSFNDDTRYYSFYHDQQDSVRKNQNYPNERVSGLQGDVYGKKSKQNKSKGNSPNRYQNERLYNKYDTRSLKSRYSIPVTFQNRQIQLMYQKMEILSKQIHQQLPLLRRQIEQNQQQIRKIENSVLIKNTAEQHHLIKILQKMKNKELQLKQKQIQVFNRDKQISFYQDEIKNWRIQTLDQKLTNKEFEMQNYYQNRLQKIKNYNQKLCSKIAQSKVRPNPVKFLI